MGAEFFHVDTDRQTDIMKLIVALRDSECTEQDTAPE